MQTMDSLPHVPQAHMKEYLKEFQKIDQQMSANQPGNIIEELTPQQEVPLKKEAHTQEQQQEEQVADNVSTAEESRSDHRNFIALREKAERAERERDELMHKFREMEFARLQQQTQLPAVSQEEETEISLAPDALAEGKHVAQIYKKMRQMETQLKQYQKQTSQNIMEAQLKAQFPDFDSVVSKAHVEELRRAHPTIAQALATAASTDAYSAAASAYTIIKEMGIAKSMQESTMTRKIIQENATKPRSAQAASPQRGTTPLSQVNEFISSDGRMTPEYQSQLLKEMNSARLQARR